MLKIRDIVSCLEAIAPLSYQEGYDNAGLITGRPDTAVTGAVLCLDATEEVVSEAIQKGCNLIVAHHPIVFRGLKKLNGINYVERTIIQAIRHDIAIYAIHTNLDNVYQQGVNARIARQLGLVNTRILAPKKEQRKLSALVPADCRERLQPALTSAGAERLAFFPTTDQTMVRVEAFFASGDQSSILSQLQGMVPETYPEIYVLENESATVGSGMIGTLPQEIEETEFLDQLKEKLRASCVRHTRLLGKPIRTVALCGGSGSFLLPQAIRQKADVYITGDFKYHEFFDADGHLVIADIGHFESEQFTIELLHEIIAKKFPNFALHLTNVITNPVFYR